MPHDVSAGGLAAALSEACLRFNTGARIGLGEVAERDGVDLFTLLFSESLGRVGFRFRVLEEVRFRCAPLASSLRTYWCGGCCVERSGLPG